VTNDPTPTPPPSPTSVPSGGPRADRHAWREERRAWRREHRRGVFGPVLLIAVGLLFLASNLGYLGPVSWFQLVQLWPLLLVLAGIDLAIGRRAPALALLIDLVVIGGAVALVAAQPGFIFGPRATGGETRVVVPRDGARVLDLRVTGGAARYTIGGGATALVEVASDRNDLRLVEDRRSGDAATVRLEQFEQPVFLASGPGNVDVKVASDVALTLRFDAGAGDFTVDLRDLKVREFRSGTGAASMRVVLPRPDGDVPIRLDSGASSITVEVPDGVEAQVHTSGLASTRNASSRFSGGGNNLETPGYATARDRVTVTISAGASNVIVR